MTSPVQFDSRAQQAARRKSSSPPSLTLASTTGRGRSLALENVTAWLRAERGIAFVGRAKLRWQTTAG